MAFNAKDTAERLGRKALSRFLKAVFFSEAEMRRIGKIACDYVRADARERGIMQSGQRYSVYSMPYKRYKANDMRRTTRNTKTGTKKLSKFKRGKNELKGNTGGSRLAGYEGLKIQSHNVAFVDMTLTGRTLNSYKPIEAKVNSVVCGYAPEFIPIILGNRARGYDVVGLSTVNTQKLLKVAKDMLFAKIAASMGETVEVNIGR